MEAAIITICLLLSAFFSGMEIAYVSANKVYLGVETKQNSFLSKILTRLTQNPPQFIASMLVGNSIVLVIYAYHMGNVVLLWLPQMHVVWQVVLQVACAVAILLATSEFLPKVFFQVYANTLIKLLALPAYLFYELFYWPSKALMLVSDFILVKILNTKGDSQKAFFTRGDLDGYVSQEFKSAHEKEEIDSEIQIFKNALEFSGVLCRDIMTPRTEIAAVAINDAVSELTQLFVDTDYSKIVVYSRDINHAVGYVHSFDLFKKPASIIDIMIPIEHVPGTMLIKEVLDLLTRRRKSMAVVLDEVGNTAGIVTTEDIIEELFGEIEDEHDDEGSLVDEQAPDGSLLLSARFDIDYINEKYATNLPVNEAYSTLGGLIVHIAGHIPAKGEVVKIGQLRLVIERASAKFIELVKISPQPIE